jgi:dolichol-phosphate mannosyltransferase
MDSDLQDDPKEIPRFMEKIAEGWDLVSGWKARRQDPWHKTLPSRIYNRVVSALFGLKLHDVNCGFKAFRAEVVKDVALYGDRHRLLAVLAHAQGRRVCEIRVEHHKRRYGRSKYGLERFSRGALDVLTLWLIVRFGARPGHFFGKSAAFFGAAAAALALLGFSWKTAGIYMVLLAAILFCGAACLLGIGFAAELLLHAFYRPPDRLFTDD